jgi:hypothetical protein
MKSVLFVCYGSGHVRMVVPVASALRRAGVAQIVVLCVTSAAPVVGACGVGVVEL